MLSTMRNTRFLLALLLCSPVLAQDKPIAAPAGSGTTSKPATTSETSVKQESITGAQKTFPSATPEAVIEVTKRIFPAVVRLDVAQEIYSEGKQIGRASCRERV